MDEEENKNIAADQIAMTQTSARVAPESLFKTPEERLDFFSVQPVGGAEVARDAASIGEAGEREAEEASKAREATQNALRAAGVAVVSAFERYATGDGSPASQRAAAYAARVLGDRIADAKGIEGGVTSTIDFDRNGDFHLRFWRKSDGFPVQFDYTSMRDGLRKQGYLDGLDKDLKEKLGIPSQEQTEVDAGKQMASASAFFAALGKLDPRTRREFSRISGAAQQFYGGDEAALAQYLDDLDAQEAAAKEAEAENIVARSGGAAQSWRFHDAWDAAWANGASTRESMLGRLESALDDGVITQAQFDRYSKQIEDRDWDTKPAEPAVDFEKEFEKEWDSTKDPARRTDLLRKYEGTIPGEKYAIFKEQLEKDEDAALEPKKTSSREQSSSSDMTGQGSGGSIVTPGASKLAAASASATAKGETAETSTLDETGGIEKAPESDDTNGPVARKGTYRENARIQDFGFVAPRGTYFDEDQLEWDSRKGKYVVKKNAKPWFPIAAGKTVQKKRTEEPKANGGKRFVHFVIDPRSVEFWETAKRAVTTVGVGAVAELLKKDKDKVGEVAADTAHEILSRLGHRSNGTAHGWPSYRMTQEEFDEFMKFVKSGKMPPKQNPAPASDDATS